MATLDIDSTRAQTGSVEPPAHRYPAHLIDSWTLADGTPVTIRPIRAGDLGLERAFVGALSPETRYQRLLSGRQLLPGELERWTDIDYGREMALVALATVDGVEQELGVARYVREPDAAVPSADFAVVVGDRWHGRGIGEKLLRSLLRAAVDDGIEVVTGITLTSNAAMLALAHKLGFTATRERGNAIVTDLRWEAAAELSAMYASIGAVAYADMWSGMA